METTSSVICLSLCFSFAYLFLFVPIVVLSGVFYQFSNAIIWNAYYLIVPRNSLPRNTWFVLCLIRKTGGSYTWIGQVWDSCLSYSENRVNIYTVYNNSEERELDTRKENAWQDNRGCLLYLSNIQAWDLTSAAHTLEYGIQSPPHTVQPASLFQLSPAPSFQWLSPSHAGTPGSLRYKPLITCF